MQDMINAIVNAIKGLLDALLANGIINQDIYDSLANVIAGIPMPL